MRREVAEYALRFLGGEYVYGGTDPNEGVDCSGFTRYVLSKAASIDLPHSSRGQADFGTAVTAGFVLCKTAVDVPLGAAAKVYEKIKNL